MAVKHSYYTDKTSEEMKEAWQKSTRKRYNSPQKIDWREGRDRSLGWNKTENWRRYEGNNIYAEPEWMEENGSGNTQRKKNSRELIEDAFRKTKKK